MNHRTAYEQEEKAQARKMKALVVAVQAGVNSGKGRDAKAVFDRLREKYRQMTGDRD